jgi:hypothetical protein
VAALPALAGAIVRGAPLLADAWFAHTPALTHLALDRCGAVVGSATGMGGRLPGLTHLAVSDCDAFTGTWLGAAGGGGRSARLHALTVQRCRALSLWDVLAPVPHPRLRWARFADVASPVSSWDEQLGGRLPALRALAVEGCPGFVGGPALGGRLPALRDLAVEGCAYFSGACLGGLPSLRRVVLADCPAVGRDALAAAAGGCPALTSVHYGYDRIVGSSSIGGHRRLGAATPPPMPSALGPGWAAVAAPRSFLPITSHETGPNGERHEVTGWAATRARDAAATGAGGGGGSRGNEEEEGQGEPGAGPAPPAGKRARVGP